MKKIDCYKLSIHNIINNKSRSILTTIIVYIMSLLIISLLSFGISFSNNVYDIINKYYKEAEDCITTSYYGGNDNVSFDINKYNELIECYKDNDKVFSTARFGISNFNLNAAYIDYNFYKTDNIKIIEGRDIDSSDSNTNRIIISKEYKNRLWVNVGDSFYQNIYSNDGTSRVYEFNVIGVYDFIDESDSTNYDSIVGIYDEMIIDMNYMLNLVTKVNISYAHFYYFTSDSGFNAKTLQKDLTKFNDDLRKIFPKNNYEGQMYDSIHCYALDDMKMAFIVRIVIIGIVAFICLILILLSIGSLANTIMISVDRNKKFIGLLKALGLNERNLKSIIKMESITTIASGVLLSFFSLFLVKGKFAEINYRLVKSGFASYLGKLDYQITYKIPFYIPIIVMLFFIFFTFVFSKGSMSKITKTDPMAVISEVA